MEEDKERRVWPFVSLNWLAGEIVFVLPFEKLTQLNRQAFQCGKPKLYSKHGPFNLLNEPYVYSLPIRNIFFSISLLNRT
jgi:hypothetical protein